MSDSLGCWRHWACEGVSVAWGMALHRYRCRTGASVADMMALHGLWHCMSSGAAWALVVRRNRHGADAMVAGAAVFQGHMLDGCQSFVGARSAWVPAWHKHVAWAPALHGCRHCVAASAASAPRYMGVSMMQMCCMGTSAARVPALHKLLHGHREGEGKLGVICVPQNIPLPKALLMRSCHPEGYLGDAGSCIQTLGSPFGVTQVGG